MRKFIFTILAICLVACVAVTLVSCTGTESNTKNVLSIYGETDTFEFYVDEINWSVIKLSVYDEELETSDVITVQRSMVTEEDLARLNAPGTYTVSLIYQGSTVNVTIVLKQKFVAAQFEVTYNAGEGTFNADGVKTDGSDIKVEVCSVISAIPTPVRPGYEFAGWFESPDFTGSKIIAPYNLKRDITLYAKWSDERKYGITYSCYLGVNNHGVLSTVSDIEHGSTVQLLAPENRVGYDFAYYEIWDASEIYNAETSQKLEYNNAPVDYVVTSSVKIKLQYVPKMLNLTFIADGWNDGEEIGGVKIENKTYNTQVSYGTVISENVLPVPTLPQKTGYTANWIDESTGKAPVFGTVIADIVIRAEYSIMQFSMYFYTDKNFTDSSLLQNATRTVNYGSFVTSIPDVPAKDGYNGEWMVYNKGYDTSVEDNQPVAINLRRLQMKEDVKVFAQYYPKTYDIGFEFKMEGMQSEVRVVKQFKFGEYIAASDVPDLSADFEYDDVTYEGYPQKYYSIVWYTNKAHTTRVTFPVKVTGESNFYYDVVQNPYVIEFRMRDISGEKEILPETRNVKPGENVLPPEWLLEAYTIVGWEYNSDRIENFDATKIYRVGDCVVYNQEYYYCEVPTAGTAPDNTAYWSVATIPPTVSFLFVSNPDYINGIPVSDFHEYSDVVTENRAFYPILKAKSYKIEYRNVNIETGLTEVIIEAGSDVPHGSRITLMTEEALRDRGYGKSTYVFDGWYLDPDGLTLPIDNTYVVTDAITLYARWTDTLVGTAGLQYATYKEGYAITSFVPQNAEYSHISVRIPANHNGLPVVAIKADAFDGFDKVIYITEIIIGANVSEIGENAFSACNYLTKFTLDGNTNYVVSDSDGCLYSADGKTLIRFPVKKETENFIVPSSVEHIAGGAFAYASSIKSISFGAGSALKSIGAYAFDGCMSLTTITLPANIEAIGEYAFRGCSALSNIDASSAVELYKVGYGAFDDCSNALATNGSYLQIANVLVRYCGNATTLILDDSIKGIADGAFARRTLEAEVSGYALATLTVRSTSSLKYIGARAFASCAALKEIHLATPHVIAAEKTSFDGLPISCELYVSSSLLNDYSTNPAYSSFKNATGESLIYSE